MPASEKKDTLLSAKAHAAVILASFLWGACGVFVRTLDGLGYNTLSIVFVRVFIAFVILFAVLFVFNRALLRIRIKDLWVFICAAASSAVFLNLFYSLSTIINHLAFAAVMIQTAPFFVVFMSAPLFKEKITSVTLAALVIVFSGCVLTSGLVGSGLEFKPFGVLIGLLSGVGYALYSIFSRVGLNKGYNSLTINVYSFGLGALFCVPFTDFAIIFDSISARPAFMGVFLLIHSLMISLLPYTLYTYGLRHMATGKASIVASLEPVAATVLGVFLYSEILSLINYTGIVLVLLGIALLNLPRGFKTFSLKLKR